MNYQTSVISLLFFMATIMYFFCGAYIMWINSKSKTNRMFLFLCLSIGVWSLGFGMANISRTRELALFWHRFAALGWTTSYGFILHFLILLTKENTSLKKERSYWLLHIPGIISMYIFAISEKLAPLHYNLFENKYGWINKLNNNHWDFLFNIYYMSYILIGILIIWNWQKKTKNKTIARQGQFIIGALILSSIIGSFTDRIAISVMENPLPQMAPLFILIPTLAMYHSSRYYRVLEDDIIDRVDTIVTAEDKLYISDQVSMSFYLVGLIVFLVEYIPHINQENAFKTAFLRGLVFIAFGIIIKIIQSIENQVLKENLIILSLVASVPLVLFQYFSEGSTTIWAFPMIIVIISTIFSRRTLIYSTTAVAIITQIIFWILRPQVTLVINQYDYILRIAMFLIAFSTGLFINKIHVEKVEENKFQGSFQKMNTRISSDFISINKNNLDEKFNRLLEEMGLFFRPDRISLYTLDEERNEIEYSYEWCNQGIESEIEKYEKLYIEDFTWWIKELEENKIVSIEDIREMPEEGHREKEEMEKLKIKSIVCVPVEGKDGVSAFLVISSINTYRKWPDEDVKLLHIMANLISDALLKIRSEKEVEYMAYYDALTNIPNRILFKKTVDKAIEEVEKTGDLISIIYLGIDNFKSVNAIIGYAGGDRLLKEVAKNLTETVGKCGQVARFGGDEFMISLDGIKNHKELIKKINKIMESFLETFNLNGQELLITCRAGVATYPKDGESAEKLIEHANFAMQHVGEKSRYEIYEPRMKKETEDRLALVNDLQNALEKDELTLYYQPQIDLKTGKINGAEALIRWIHPERGMISPGVFIPLAEENGLINSIGEWVLKTACKQNKKWQDMGLEKLPVGVNLSAAQLIDANIVNYVTKVLEKSGLDSKYLELEITESVTIKDGVYISRVLNRLKDMGIVIAIDDFGTEHSSFSRLKTLPIDRIKIDMQFIQGIEKSKKDRTITKIMINLAEGLDLNVIAEGVETKEQLEFLKENKCDDVQGYYYYKPMEAEEIEKLFNRRD